MGRGRKILLIWVAIVIAMAITVLFETHQLIGRAASILLSLQVLIGLIAFFLAVHEPNRKNRFLFINFSFFFLISVLSFISGALEPVLSSIDRYLPFVITQYNKGVYYAVLAFSIVYLVLDSLFRDLKVSYKYFPLNSDEFQFLWVMCMKDDEPSELYKKDLNRFQNCFQVLTKFFFVMSIHVNEDNLSFPLEW